MPRTKELLYNLYKNEEAVGFHVSHFPKGHFPTNFNQWFHTESHYPVTYVEGFEPYVIAYRNFVPRYDERFRGYGMNKVNDKKLKFLLKFSRFNISII